MAPLRVARPEIAEATRSSPTVSSVARRRRSAASRARWWSCPAERVPDRASSLPQWVRLTPSQTTSSDEAKSGDRHDRGCGARRRAGRRARRRARAGRAWRAASSSQSAKCDAIAAPVAIRTTSATALPAPKRTATGRIAVLVAAHGRGDRGHQHQLAADEERERDDVQEADERPHQGAARSPVGRRRPASAGRSRNGLERSSGSGNTIVEFWSAPISSSVCR